MPDLSDKVSDLCVPDHQIKHMIATMPGPVGLSVVEARAMEKIRSCLTELLAYRTRLPASSMEGWRLVPEEPTREMILAAEDELENQTDSDWASDADGNRHDYTTRRPGWERAVFQRMLAASPIPPEVMK